MHNKIIIKGAREHNLKNIHLEIPRDKLVVFTGISGSGKSTLAFDTIFAEGQRRYLESLSSYARQFLGQMKKPDVDHIDGLSPTISIDQKSASHNPRSTVGTVTEIHDYLRLLFAKIGVPHCIQCGKTISSLTIDQIADRALDMGSGIWLKIFAPVVRSRKGEYLKFLQDFYDQGFYKARINGKIYELGKTEIKLAKYKKHVIDILVDEFKLDSENLTRLNEALEIAVRIANGLVEINGVLFNTKNSCSDCNIAFSDLEPRLFSFNSPYGACSDCGGLGLKKEISDKLIMPDLSKSIDQGGVLPWSYRGKSWFGTLIRAICEHYNIPITKRLKDISEKKRDILLYGSGRRERISVRYQTSGGRVGTWHFYFSGMMDMLSRRYEKTESEAVRKDIEHYMDVSPCVSCNGTRYNPEPLAVTVGDKNIAQLSSLSVSHAYEFFTTLKVNKRELLIADRVLKEIRERLRFLVSVGLGYLTLDRSANTLAGGEAQRIRLASQVGSGLMGVLYILDEPSIGLHARDNARLLEILEHLRDIGNTVVVIEHDEETMRRADYLVDIGPGAGKHGGEIVAYGTPEQVIKNTKSLTGKYLCGQEKIEVPHERRKLKKDFITVIGATEHNLKNVKVHIPLGVFTCVTGVSGSGKSTLVNDVLYKGIARKLYQTNEKPGKHARIDGIENIDKIIRVDQSPIGRTPRSNPATYTKVFGHIRELFSKTKTAKVRGYSPGRFSFNVKGGRCEACSGDGSLRIEMQFLPDVLVPCDVCQGKRYGRETLEVTYKGKNISNVLEMTVEEAWEFFRSISQIADILQVLKEVGLGYIQLGQSAITLSGGEAQRVKLASELAKRSTGSTFYILDEPTTGLHFEDVKKLLAVLNRLVEAGNTVLVIEHHMDVIKSADYIIDLGPEGGDAGGQIIITGTPEEVAKYYQKSYTGKFLKKVLKQ